MSDMRLIIMGAGGRMGRTLVKAMADTNGFALAGAVETAGSSLLGQDAGVLAGLTPNGIKLTPHLKALLGNADAIIDFTAPSASVAHAALAGQAKVAHVIGTTGLTAEDDAKIAAAAKTTTIVKSGNMSMGINLLAALVERAAKSLPDYDAEVLEMHHRNKVDAPSGTALLLGQAAAKGHGVPLDKHWVKSRDGHNLGPRADGSIGFATLRGGSVVGEHSVIFAGTGERITLSHSAEDRSIFAHGALTAAKWGHGKKPGLYAMTDVLGL